MAKILTNRVTLTFYLGIFNVGLLYLNILNFGFKLSLKFNTNLKQDTKYNAVSAGTCWYCFILK